MTSEHRIALISQKIGELLSLSMERFKVPYNALEDIYFVFDEFEVTKEERIDIFIFLYGGLPDGMEQITLGEIKFMMSICYIDEFTLRPAVPRHQIGGAPTPTKIVTPDPLGPSRRYIPPPDPLACTI